MKMAKQGETSGFCEQKQDVSESYYGADGQPLVPRSQYSASGPGTAAWDHVEDDDDVYRSVSMMGDEDRVQKQRNTTSAWDRSCGGTGGDFGLPQKQMGARAYQYESYDSGIVRSLDVGTQYMGTQQLRDSPLETYQGQSRLVHDKKYPIQMAPTGQKSVTQFRSRATNDAFWNDDLDDESSEGGMMMEEDSEQDGIQGSFCPLPECYRKDSTYRSIVSGSETVDAVEKALMALRKANNSVDYSRINSSQFSGHFYERARCCEFMVNTYQGVQDAREQTWVECRNLDSSLGSKQAFAVFLKEVVATLTRLGTIDGLVHRDFVTYTGLQEESGTQDNSSVDDEEVRVIIQERIRGLKQASFLGKQREFSEEVLFLAEQHPGLVAQNPELAPVLADLLKNNAKTDVYMSRTILRLMRALLAYNRFEEGLKKATSDPIKMLLQITKKTENRAWQGDLFNTVLELQRIGFTCNGKRANAEYRRIETRVGAINFAGNT